VRNPGIAAYVAGCLVTGSLIGGWLVFRERALDRVEEERRVAVVEQLDRLLRGAVDLAHAGNWKTARERLVEIRSIDPRFSTLRVSELLAASEREVANQEHLEGARVALENRDLAEAAKELGLVPPGTAQLQLREALLKDLTRLANERAREAQALAPLTTDRVKMVELQALTAEILIAAPGHSHALVLQRWADDAMARLDLRDEVAANKTPWVDVKDYFRDGDLDSALPMAELCALQHARCKALLPGLQRFRDELDGEANQARLLKIEREILGPAGGFWRADALVEQARAAKEKEDFKAALATARKALDISPAHAEASALMDELHDLGEELFYQVEDAPLMEQRRLLRKVLALTEPSDDFHALAQRQLQELKK
jgi:hypothetical protein